MTDPTATSTNRSPDDSTLHQILEGSRVYRSQEQVRRKLATATPNTDPAAGSILVRLGTRSQRKIECVVRASFLYRWLTAEPDPEVIVIDLRETHTVAPFIALLDWLLAGLARAARGSGVVEGYRALRREFVKTPVRLVGIGLGTVGATWIVLAILASSITWVAIALGLVFIGLLAVRDRRSLAAVRETRLYELLAAAFTPPEPPEDDRNRNR